MENREQKQKERHCRFPLSGIMRLKALHCAAGCVKRNGSLQNTGSVCIYEGSECRPL